VKALALRPALELPAEPPVLRLVDLDQPPVEPAYGNADRLVRRAERHNREGEFGSALEVMSAAWPLLDQGARPDVVLRALETEAWARMYTGELDRSLELLERARTLVERPQFTDVDRAEVLYRIGCCRTKLSQVAQAVELFTLALDLCDTTHLPCDRLRAEILEWRSRCYQRRRDLDAARTDVERALELAEKLGDRHTAAHVYFQASLVAERTKQWLLARYYADEARTSYERVGDRPNLARMLNNLGGINFLLGNTELAVMNLTDAFRVALDAGCEAESAQAVSSLAQVHLRSGDHLRAEEQARHALELLEGRADFRDELGNCRLVLGKALLAQGKDAEAEACFAEAEDAFSTLGSPSHSAAAWMAQGELAAGRGESERAVDLFRRAAEALQDLHF
jgi:tetratricopeptide (TPR) repeat protein